MRGNFGMGTRSHLINRGISKICQHDPMIGSQDEYLCIYMMKYASV